MTCLCCLTKWILDRCHMNILAVLTFCCLDWLGVWTTPPPSPSFSLFLSWTLYLLIGKYTPCPLNFCSSIGTLAFFKAPCGEHSLPYCEVLSFIGIFIYVELQCVNSEPLFLCGSRAGVFICLPVAGLIMASHSVPQWWLHMCLQSIHSVVLGMLPLYTQKQTTHILAVRLRTWRWFRKCLVPSINAQLY